ncbi:cytochrome b5 domain-containing protein [Clostridium sp. 1001271B_151109_B4]|uniref:cytochrome b5 domain-containing protein n=1 Tax=Clostridium sp. 1001271B_151109_B4 TaxID=2787148 RepID=UPI0018A9D36B|nr:cytochrome b5 domain-containing protein [Clostridium sp. 1001271B_151109_B4]
MAKKDFLEQKYCEINKLKNLLQTYPKEYAETIIKVMQNVFDEISEYLDEEANKLKKIAKIDIAEKNIDILEKKIDGLNKKIEKTKGQLSEKEKCKNVGNKANKEETKEDKKSGKRQDFSSREELRYYTMDEVAKFDGCDGSLAYVVIEGTVYDVTAVKEWRDGRHYGLYAGRDLTEYFNTCHKDEKNILNKLRIVGTIKN